MPEAVVSSRLHESSRPGAADRASAEASGDSFGVEFVKPATFLERARKHRIFVFSSVMLALIIAAAIFAPLIAPHDPYLQDLAGRMTPPVFYEGGSWDHILGKDGLGRDYLSRIIYGTRISLLIGCIATAVSCLIGVSLGVAAGYFGGRVDMAVSFLLMIRLTLPVLLVLLATAAVVRGSVTGVVLIMGCLLWDQFAVIARSTTQQIRAADYVRSARALGCSQWQIIRADIVPNILNPIIVVITFEIASAILLESSLSFLGLGVQPPFASWGLMIAEAKDSLFFQPWLIAFPGAALFVLCLGINLFGDGLRDLAGGQGRV